MALSTSNISTISLQRLALSSVQVILGSVFLGLVSQVAFQLPWTPTRVSTQTFALFMMGITLGPKKAFLAVLLHLCQGIAGLPVFALGQSGISVLLGPNGGFYLSFSLAAAISGLAKKEDSVIQLFMIFLAANATIFAFGLLWLSFFIGFSNVLPLGLYPFLVGDFLKISSAIALTKGFHTFTRTHS